MEKVQVRFSWYIVQGNGRIYCKYFDFYPQVKLQAYIDSSHAWATLRNKLMGSKKLFYSTLSLATATV